MFKKLYLKLNKMKASDIKNESEAILLGLNEYPRNFKTHINKIKIQTYLKHNG